MIIPRKFAQHYKDVIGFNLQEKVEALDKLIEYNERDGIHSAQEMIDKIPELGEIIAETGPVRCDQGAGESAPPHQRHVGAQHRRRSRRARGPTRATQGGVGSHAERLHLLHTEAGPAPRGDQAGHGEEVRLPGHRKHG